MSNSISEDVAKRIAKAKNRQRGKKREEQGRDTEAQVVAYMHALGFQCIDQIENGWRVHRTGGRIVGASPAGKVAGDIHALWGPRGRGVRVEVKSTLGPESSSLPYGRLEGHQRKSLRDYNNAGGLALVAWVSRFGVALFSYVEALKDGWQKGTPLKWEQAEMLRADLIQYLKETR